MQKRKKNQNNNSCGDYFSMAGEPSPCDLPFLPVSAHFYRLSGIPIWFLFCLCISYHSRALSTNMIFITYITYNIAFWYWMILYHHKGVVNDQNNDNKIMMIWKFLEGAAGLPL